MKGQQAASERLSGLAETVVWVVAFCFASTSMTMLNKAAVKALPFPYWLCVLQNIATILLVGAVVSTCVPSGHPTFGLVRSLDWEVVTLWLPAVAMFIVMLVSSLSALHAVSVPTVLVFRSLTPLCTAILESMWLRVRYAWATWASLTLILIGAVCYVIATPRDGDSANNIRREISRRLSGEHPGVHVGAPHPGRLRAGATCGWASICSPPPRTTCTSRA